MSFVFLFIFYPFRSNFFWKTVPKSNIGLYCRIFAHIFIIGIKIAGEISDLFIGDRNYYVLRRSNDICLRVGSVITVEVATVRIFAVRHVYILDDLRQLAKSFGLAWQFCTARSGMSITCNRANRKSSYSGLGVRRSTSISCGCKWSIRFLGVVKCNNKSSDPVEITRVTPSHSDTCDPLNVDQLVLCRSRSGAYARCGDEILKEIMV